MDGPLNINFTELYHEVQFISPVIMDTFGAAYQTAQLLAATIKLVREAVERQRDQAEVLLKAESELEETKCIVELVQDHEALQASGPLLANLKRIQILNSLLQDQISSMSIDRGTLKAFKHQVMQGASERQDLAAIVERLAKAKQDLGLHIQLVHVGLTMDANRAIGVNLRLVEEMNEVVRTVLGKEKGLMIASFVDEKVRGGKPLEGDGRMQLTTSEYRALLMMNHLGNARAESVSSENTKASAPRRKERYVNDNLAVESTQINVPIEVDVWAHMDYVNVQGNVATRNSLQVNYPMTLDVYREVRGGGSQKSSRKYSKK